MLEYATLLLRPWAPVAEAAEPWKNAARAGWFRLVLDGASERAIGCIAWRRGPGWRWLWPLQGQTLKALETEDGALLCTMRRPWGLFRMWQILDAEQRRVASAYRRVLLDAGGRRLATLAAPPGNGDNAWRGAAQQELAVWQRLPHGGRLFQFAPEAPANPFLRMALLAGFLVQLPWPGQSE